MPPLKGFEPLEASLIPTSAGSSIHAYHTPSSSVASLPQKDGPVLVFLHGYPQSKYMYVRLLVPSHQLLPEPDVSNC